MNALRSPVVLVTTTAVSIAAVLVVLNFYGEAATPSAAHVAVRVDQVGYVRGETKQAYVMGPTKALAGARFKVVDAKNRVATAGRLGAATGHWNARFPSVRTVDLSALDKPGTYRIVLSGSAAAAPPPSGSPTRAS